MCPLPRRCDSKRAPFSRHGDHQFLSPCAGAMLRLQTRAVRGLMGLSAGSESEVPCLRLCHERVKVRSAFEAFPWLLWRQSA